MQPNLLSHQILCLIQEYAEPEFLEDAGYRKLATVVNDGLAQVGSSIESATVSDYRRLWHDEWRGILKSVCPPSYQELLNDRYKQLVF